MKDEEWADPFAYQEVRGSRSDGPKSPPTNRPEPEFDSVLGSGPRLDSVMSTLAVFAIIACSLFAIGLAWLLICWVPCS
jgi:hypothetical protein